MKKIFGIGILTFLCSCAGMSGNIGGIDLGMISTGVDAGTSVWKASEDITPKKEYYIGRSVAANVFHKYNNNAINNAALTKYVNEIANTLAVRSKLPETYGGYHVQILRSNELNALAAPGGFIFITSGLMKLAPNEDALASILAHEVAHVVLGHGRKAIQAAHLTDAATKVGKEAGRRAASRHGGAMASAAFGVFGGQITGVVDTLLDKGYSRGQEEDADEYALELLEKAGYNPYAMIEMFHAMQAVQKSNSGGLFSTHPDMDDRIEEVEDELGSGAEKVIASQAARAGRFQKHMRMLG